MAKVERICEIQAGLGGIKQVVDTAGEVAVCAGGGGFVILNPKGEGSPIVARRLAKLDYHYVFEGARLSVFHDREGGRVARLFVFLFREPRGAARKGVFSLRLPVVLHDGEFFRPGILSCCTTATFSSKSPCRAARQPLFHQNPLVVQHDSHFFIKISLSCSTTEDFFHSAL